MIAGLAALDIRSEDVRHEPTVARTPVHVPALDLVVEPGAITGWVQTAVATTRQGVTVEVRLVGKCFEPGEEEYAHATVSTTHLDRPITLRVSPLPGVETTIGIALSRVPDVLAAAPGFVRAEDLPSARFRVPEPGRRVARA
ncbi:hypothetical protein [Georgenia sp. AZ-5]|uniref:hypothetical protein n=1 Tax=Georgenia sp. AZ-5 TaxID=3367526 RepID=UPI0037551322